MKILITGANGLLGQKLVQLLATQANVEIIATSRGECRIKNFDLSLYYKLDVTSQDEVVSKITQLKPDVVIHTAAMTQVDDCELHQEQCKIENIEAVQNVVKGCELAGAHLVHLSTDFIFDGSEGPLTEDALANPVNFYGESKLEAERIIMNSSISWAIARTVLVFGIVPDLSRSNIILWVKDSLENKKTIKVVDDQWRTPTLAEDLAMGCWLIAKNKASGVFNISGYDMLTPYDMAQEVAKYFNLDNSFITRANSATFSQPAKRPARTGFIIDKARNELGYHPRSFREGIKIIADQIK